MLFDVYILFSVILEKLRRHFRRLNGLHIIFNTTFILFIRINQTQFLCHGYTRLCSVLYIISIIYLQVLIDTIFTIQHGVFLQKDVFSLIYVTTLLHLEDHWARKSFRLNKTLYVDLWFFLL